MTSKIALTTLATRLPSLQLAVAREKVVHLPLDSINALQALPVRSRPPVVDGAFRGFDDQVCTPHEADVFQ